MAYVLSKLEVIRLLQGLECQRVNMESSKRRAARLQPDIAANRQLAAKLGRWLGEAAAPPHDHEE